METNILQFPQHTLFIWSYHTTICTSLWDIPNTTNSPGRSEATWKWSYLQVSHTKFYCCLCEWDSRVISRRNNDHWLWQALIPGQRITSPVTPLVHSDKS
jgi:hypothetical protein